MSPASATCAWRERERQTERQRDRETKREKGKYKKVILSYLIWDMVFTTKSSAIKLFHRRNGLSIASQLVDLILILVKYLQEMLEPTRVVPNSSLNLQILED